MICGHRHFEFLFSFSRNLFAFVLASCDFHSSSLIPQGIPSLIMSSFLSDSAIDMGGNDSGDSIQQPLMDQEVIFIGSSSKEDTRCNASDNESSSLERLRVSCHTGGGTSRLHRKTWPSATSPARELIPVIVILSPSFSKGARTSGRDIRASPHVRRSHSVGSPSSSPIVTGYDCVRDDILKYKSSLTFAVSVAAMQCQVKLANLDDSWKVVVQPCRSNDFSFLRAASGNSPFFFIYRCLFEVLDLILPLTASQCALLKHLNVVFSQLHPND